MIAHLFGGAALPQPNQWWLAVYDEDPTDALTNTTPTPVTSLLQILNWTLSNNEVSNTNIIQFEPVPVGETWTVSHFALFDASSGGNPLYHGAFRTAKVLQEGDILFIAAGQLVIREL